MSTAKQEFLTPVGRLVQGHPMEKQDKNMHGQPLMTMNGQPTQRYFCALAFKKTDQAFAALRAQLQAQARAAFPHLFDAAGNCSHPRFSWKLVDGDGVDDNGKPNATKEGFAGHWILKFQSSFPPRCFYAGRYGPQDQIADPNVIKRGYFARVAGTIEGNAHAQKPGLYVNLSMFELSAEGPVIQSGPDAGAVFGAAPVAALPLGAVPMPSVGAPALPMPGVGAPALPMPGVGVPALPVVPNPAFAAGPGALPPMPGMPPSLPVAPPAGPQLTPAGVASGFTVAQYLQAGWTEAALRQQGLIV